MLPKSERIKVFYARLAAAPAAGSFDEAFALLCDTLNAVEDELTGIPFNPDMWKTDGRMYPPQLDREFSDPARPNVRQFQSVGHITAIGFDGSIEIRHRTTNIVFFSKAGRS
jgi:hypothetical protein